VQTAAGLEVSSFKGEYEQRLEFLGSLPPLRYFGSLYSFPFDYAYLYGLDTLKSLKFLTLRESSIDFHRFPNLESAVVPWHAGLDTIFECRRLRALSLLGYRGNNSSKFAPLSSLQVLKLKDCTLAELDFFPGIKRLQRVEIGLSPRLTSLEPLLRCSGIGVLRISKCGKAADYHVLGRLKKLIALLIDTERVTESIEFAESLSGLRIFNFALDVRDGDIKRLLKCPTLVSVRFGDRRSYNIRCDDLNHILRSTRQPLNAEEVLSFRVISHGVSYWRTMTGPENILVQGS